MTEQLLIKDYPKLNFQFIYKVKFVEFLTKKFSQLVQIIRS